MKEFLVIKNYKVMNPVVDASFDEEDKARQYADLCKLRDGGEYRVAKLIQSGSGVMPLSYSLTNNIYNYEKSNHYNSVCYYFVYRRSINSILRI